MSTDTQQHFAQVVLAAFEKRGLTTDEMVRFAGGPSNTTMTVLRKVARGETTMKEPRSDTARRIERAAYWKSGSVLGLWREQKEPALQPPPVLADDFRRDVDPNRERPTYPPLPKMRERAPIRLDPYDPLSRVVGHMADLEDRIEVLETFMEEQTNADSAAPNRRARASRADELDAKRRQESIDRALKAAREAEADPGDED